MAQSGYTPIQLYYSTTAAAVPTSGNLANGELAINITDGKLYYKNNSGVVSLLASNATSAPVLSFSAGTTGFTPSTATSGAITLAGTLATTNGGTGLTAFTANQVFYASSTSAFAQSANLTFNGTTLTANTIGAFTLSGTIAGGGNQINNVIIGTTTPLAGAFTTLSATTSAEVNGTYPKIYLIETDVAADNKQWWFESNAGVFQARVLNDAISAATTWLSATRSGATITQTVLNASTGGNVYQQINGTTVTNVSSTGLAVTGSLSSTTGATFATSSGNVGIGTASPTRLLEVQSASTGTVNIANFGTSGAGGQGILFGIDTTNSYVFIKNNSSATYGMSFWSGGGTESFRFGPAGQFGIGGATYGTAGQVLTSGGASAAPTWATAASGGAFQSIQVFATAGTFTYTRPSGLTRALIYCTGAGGGAGYGGAGGSGGTAIKLATAATIGASLTVTVGTGGTTANPGNAGGSSSFGSVCSATGGPGGRYGGGTYPGQGGTGTGGDQNLTGSGADGFTGGFGGPSFWGGGGNGPDNDPTYAHGGVGSQGSGGGSSSDSTTYGGNGGPGYVVVWEFY